MTYSCTDFTDDILNALAIDVPEESADSPSDQADLALAEIEHLQLIAAQATRLLAKIDAITSEDFAKGGERAEREALRLSLFVMRGLVWDATATALTHGA